MIPVEIQYELKDLVINKAMAVFHKITKSAKLVTLLIIPTYAKNGFLVIVYIFIKT
jgi:hypothetical protein